MARIIEGERSNLVGSNIKRLRKKRKWSQKRLSEKLEILSVYICRGSISRIEDGTRTVTDIEIYALAQVLGCSIAELFENIVTEIFEG